MKLQQDELFKLVTDAQNGDNDALGTLFEAYYDSVYHFALNTVKDENLAENITQETCVEVMNTITNLRDPLAFNSWLRRITYHQCTRYFKKRKDVLVDENEDGETIFDTLQEDSIEALPEEVLEKKDLQKIIRDLIDTLPEEQRSAMMLYYHDELSIKEIADIQGVPEGTIKSRLNYGRKALMASVNDYEKKNNIKLHAIPFFPLFSLLFKNESVATMPAGFVADCASKAAGAAVDAATSVAAETATSVATETAKTVVEEGVKATVGSVAKETVKKTAVSLGTKIIAGVIAAGIVTGSGATYVAVHNHNENTKIENQGVINGIIDQIKYKSVDIYEDIEDYIVYDGYGGEATARVEFPQDYNRQVGDITIISNGINRNQIKLCFEDEILGVIDFRCEGENLSKGDTITVIGPEVGEGIFYTLEEKGYNFTSLTTQITVPTLPVYVTDKSQITKEHILEYIKFVQADNPDGMIKGVYFVANDDPEIKEKEKALIMVFVHRTLPKPLESGTYDAWHIECHNEIVLQSDGSIIIEKMRGIESVNNYAGWLTGRNEEHYGLEDYFKEVQEKYPNCTFEKIS